MTLEAIIARALPNVLTLEEAAELYGEGTDPLDVPYEWFTTPRELAVALVRAIAEDPETVQWLVDGLAVTGYTLIEERTGWHGTEPILLAALVGSKP